MTFEQIKELIEIVTRQQLQRVEIERSGFRLRIDGRPAEAGETPSAPRATDSAPPRVAAAAEPASAAEARADTEPEPEREAEAGGLHVLHSPIVGTFYTAPSPDADPYVSVGERVKKGQVLCIVEAMKLMNEIESDVSGVLREIYPKNAQPVEFGEPLFAIDPE